MYFYIGAVELEKNIFEAPKKLHTSLKQTILGKEQIS